VAVHINACVVAFSGVKKVLLLPIARVAGGKLLKVTASLCLLR
jgi:hypothetical protein